MENEFENHPDHLEPGETIIWRGHPRQGFFLRSVDIYILTMVLLWIGSVWMMRSRTGLSQSYSVNIFASGNIFRYFLSLCPLIIFGIYLFVIRYKMDAYTRKNTHYAISNMHILIWIGIGYPTETSLPINELPEIILKRGQNGSGSLIFGDSHPLSWINYIYPARHQRYYEPPTFEFIPDVDHVLKLIQQVNPNVKFHELIV